MLAKLILAITMAVSAVLGGGAVDHASEGVSAVGNYYLHTDDRGVPTLWSESNGVPGLQTDLVLGFDGRLVPPDTRLTI